MPSIELLSVNCSAEILLPKYRTFSCCAELGMPIGHRGSFDNLLRGFKGFFVHLGNPDQVAGENLYWSADDLIDLSAIDAQRSAGIYPLKISFKNKVTTELVDMIKRLLIASPIGHVLFLSDYQLAEIEGWHYPVTQLREELFMDALVTSQLDFNTLYSVMRTG